MTGPYQTAQQAREASTWLRQGRAAGLSVSHSNLAALVSACRGLDLGVYDKEVISWLSGWEPAISTVIAGLIRRAREAGPDGAS